VGLEERRGVEQHQGGLRAALGEVSAAAEEEVEGCHNIKLETAMTGRESS